MKSEETIEVEIIIRKKHETITLHLPVCSSDYKFEPEWEKPEWFSLETCTPLIYTVGARDILKAILFKVRPMADRETGQYGTYKVRKNSEG